MNRILTNVYSFDRKLVVDLELVGGETDVEVYDMLGRKVMQRKVPGEVKHRLDLDTKNRGGYCVASKPG